jgi:hypothetical protein
LQANSWSSRLDADVKAKDAELEQLKVAHQRDFFKVKEMKEKVQVELADRELRLADERRLHEAEKGAVLEQEQCAPTSSRWVTPRARWVTLRARWVTLRARWVTRRARWVTLRARWVTLRARWVTLTARWVTL